VSPSGLAIAPRALALAATFSFCSLLSAQSQPTWYVDGTCGDDAWSGTSPVCGAPDGPKRTIQAGLDAAGAGDLVLVADGVYAGEGNEWLYFPWPQWSTLRSLGGPERCVIDLEGSGGLAFFFVLDEGPEARVEGFTIRNGAASPAGAIYFHHASRVAVSDCVFENNVNHYGAGAIYVDNDASPTIQGCWFTGNASLTGGGAIGFAGSSASRPTVVNCAFTGNTAPEGAAVYFAGFDDEPALIQCTIAGNASEEGALYLTPFSRPQIVNSIVWGNAGGAIGGDGGIGVSFCDVEGGWPGVGNIDADPLLSSLSFPRLTRGSPCIDAGDNSAVPPGVTLDLAGSPRFLDGDLDGVAIVDMGAFESGRPPRRLRAR
jgi:hypothetical protein